MTNIEVRIDDDINMKMSGHAEWGKIDIVCSALSVLSYTLISALEEHCKDRFSYQMESGYIKLSVHNADYADRILFTAFLRGFKAISEEYPNNVTYKEEKA